MSTMNSQTIQPSTAMFALSALCLFVAMFFLSGQHDDALASADIESSTAAIEPAMMVTSNPMGDLP